MTNEERRAEWKKTAHARVRALADRQLYLTADDVWKTLEAHTPKRGIERRDLGQVLLAEARAGTIEKVEDHHIPSKRRNDAPLPVWKSRTYGGPEMEMPVGVVRKRAAVCPHCGEEL